MLHSVFYSTTFFAIIQIEKSKDSLVHLIVLQFLFICISLLQEVVFIQRKIKKKSIQQKYKYLRIKIHISCPLTEIIQHMLNVRFQ